MNSDKRVSSQICGSKLQRVLTLGDGCWLPMSAGVSACEGVAAGFPWKKNTRTPLLQFCSRLPGSQASRIFNQARKTNPNLNFWARIFSGGVGDSHTKGWGPKSSVCPSKPGKSNFLAGYPGILPGYPGGARKVWEKKVWVQFLFPI